RLDRVANRTSRAVSATAVAVKSAMVTYHAVFAIIQAAARIVRNSAAILIAMPVPKRSKPILLHPPIERSASEAERLCRAADVSIVRLERTGDGVSLDGIESRRFRGQQWHYTHRRPSEGEVGGLEHWARCEDHRSLDGMAQGAHVSRPWVRGQPVECGG